MIATERPVDRVAHCRLRLSLLLLVMLLVIGSPARAEPRVTPPADTEFVRRQSLDLTIALDLPVNWLYTAQAGNVVAQAPLGRAGLVFRSVAVASKSDGLAPRPNVLISPYRPPQAFIHDILGEYRFRSIRILGWQPDEAVAKRCETIIRRPCEAVELILRWTSPEQSECIGSFKVVNATPTQGGQWFSVVAGLWGSAAAIALDEPVLAWASRSLKSPEDIGRNYLEDVLAQIRILSTNKTYNYRTTPPDSARAGARP